MISHWHRVYTQTKAHVCDADQSMEIKSAILAILSTRDRPVRAHFQLQNVISTTNSNWYSSYFVDDYFINLKCCIEGQTNAECACEKKRKSKIQVRAITIVSILATLYLILFLFGHTQCMQHLLSRLWLKKMKASSVPTSIKCFKPKYEINIIVYEMFMYTVSEVYKQNTTNFFSDSGDERNWTNKCTSITIW